MEDDLNFSKMEDDLNLLEYGRQPQSLRVEGFLNILENGRQLKYFSQWKTTSFFGKWKTTSINWKMENDHIF